MDQRVEQIFYAALEQEAGVRTAFLNEACSGDAELRREVESLLECDGHGQEVFGAAISRLAGTLPHVANGATVGSYRLVREIGQGGMGTVFLAERVDGQFKQQVAIKFVIGGEWLTTRFLQERQILALLKHPNIARLLDGGVTEQGVPYMVMEYCPGMPITTYCRQHALGVERKLELFRQVCAAVEHAHRSLIIHRDLKPGNILVQDDGQVRLLDFGIAKLLEPDPSAETGTGARWLSPDYASPEQVRGDTPTTATDVYSLGAVLYELLSGEGPHKLASHAPAEVARVICDTPVPALNRGDELDFIVMMALRKEPERRYGSVAQLSEDVGRFLSNHPVLARPDSTMYRVRKFVRRNRMGVAAAAALTLLLIASSGIAAWQARVARNEAREAQLRFSQVRKLANTFLVDFDREIRALTGSTPARTMLVKTALEYLGSLKAGAGKDPTLLREIATAYEKVGDVQGSPSESNLGKRDDAVASYKQAVALWEQLERMDPKDTSVWVGLSGALQKLSDISGPDEYLKRGVELAERALPLRLDDAEAYQAAIGAEMRLGNRQMNRSNGKAALEIYTRGLKIAEDWVKKMPGPTSEETYVLVLPQIAGAALRKGDMNLAVDTVQKTIAQRERFLEKEPGNVRHRRALYRAYYLQGLALGHPNYQHLGRREESIQSLQKAVGIAEELLTADPQNAMARTDVADGHWALGGVIGERDARAAVKLLQRAVDESRRVHLDSPKASMPRHNYARNQLALAYALGDAGERSAAMGLLREGIAMRRKIAEQGRNQPGLRHNLITPLTKLGELQLAAGDRENARRSITEAVEIADTIPRDEEHKDLTVIAASYSAMAKLAAAAGDARGAAEWRQKAASGLASR